MTAHPALQGVCVTERQDGTVAVDFAGGPFVTLTAVQWRALLRLVARRLT